MREQIEKHPHQTGRKFLERIVLGGSDGIIESVAAVSALNGIKIIANPQIVIAGIAFAIAGSISMFFSNYISRRSEIQNLKEDIKRERFEIETEPEEEKRELTEILKKEGYTQNEVDVIVGRLQQDKEMWLRAQLRHELHLYMDEVKEGTLMHSLSAGLSFLFFSIIPIIPYFFGLTRFYSLIISDILSAFSLFLLGSTKLLSFRNFNFRSGIESAFIGMVASFLLYLFGTIISLR